MPEILRITNIPLKSGAPQIINRDSKNQGGWGAKNPKELITSEITLKNYQTNPAIVKNQYSQVCLCETSNDAPSTINKLQEWAFKNGKSDLHAHFYVNIRGDIYEGRPIGSKGEWFNELQLNNKTLFICILREKEGGALLELENSAAFENSQAINNISRLIIALKRDCFVYIKTLISTTEIEKEEEVTPYPKIFKYIANKTQISLKNTLNGNSSLPELQNVEGLEYLKSNPHINYQEWTESNYKHELAALSIFAVLDTARKNFFELAKQLSVEIFFTCKVERDELLKYDAKGITKAYFNPPIMIVPQGKDKAEEFDLDKLIYISQKEIPEGTRFQIRIGLYFDPTNKDMEDNKVGKALQVIIHEAFLHGYAFLKYIEALKGTTPDRNKYIQLNTKGYLSSYYQENILSTKEKSYYNNACEETIKYLSKKSGRAASAFKTQRDGEYSSHNANAKTNTKQYDESTNILTPIK